MKLMKGGEVSRRDDSIGKAELTRTDQLGSMCSIRFC